MAKTIIVLTIGTKDRTIEELVEAFESIKKYQQTITSDVLIFTIPDDTTNKLFDVKCINPELVSKEEFLKAEEQLRQIENLFKNNIQNNDNN